MAKGINIPIAADARGVITEGKKVERALEDVIDSLDEIGDASKDGARVAERSLDDIADAAKDAGRDTERAFDNAAKDAESSAERMERSFRESFEKVEKQAKSSTSNIGKDLGDGVQDGTSRAGEGLDNFRGEADETAREVAASFDGSAESIAGGFQEVAANAFGGFGPAGAAAGLAAAAGIGIITSKMEEAKEKAQETAQEVADLAGELIDVGKADLGPEQVTDALNELATTAEDGKIPLDELRKTADKAGISFSDFARGAAGDSKALQRSYDEVDGALDEMDSTLRRLLDTYGPASGEVAEYTTRIGDEQRALLEAKKELLEHDATLDRASTTAKNFADATRGMASEVDLAAASQAAAQEVAESYASALEGMVEPSAIYGEAMDKVREKAEQAAAAAGKTPEEIAAAGEAAKVTLDDLLTELAEEVQSRTDFEANLAALAQRGFGALAATLKAKGPEAAGEVTALLAAGTDSQVQQYATSAGTLLGTNLGQGAAGGVTAQQQTLANAVAGAVKGIPVPSLVIPLEVRSTVITTSIHKNNDGSYQTYVNGKPAGMKMV
jgi:hypothetical protein